MSRINFCLLSLVFCLGAALNLNLSRASAQGTASDTARPQLALQLGHTDAVKATAFSPDGRTLATGSVDNTVKLWDVAGGGLRRTLNAHKGGVQWLTFAPDSRTLASVGIEDHTVKLWDARSGLLRRTLHWDDLDAEQPFFSPDGRRLIGIGFHTARLWDTATGALLSDLGTGEDEPEPDINAAALSPDGRMLAIGEKVSIGEQHEIGQAFTVGPKLLVTGTPKDSSGLLPDVDVIQQVGGVTVANRKELKAQARRHAPGTRVKLRVLRRGKPVQLEVKAEAIQMDTDAWQVQLRDTTTGALLHTLPGGEVDIDETGMEAHMPYFTLPGEKPFVFSPDGQSLAMLDVDYAVQVWNAATGTLKTTLPAPLPNTRAVAFSSSGQTLAAFNSVSFAPAALPLIDMAEQSDHKVLMQKVMAPFMGFPGASPSGILPGDIIEKAGATTLDHAGALQAELKRHRPGDRLVLTVRRNGKQLQRTVPLVAEQISANLTRLWDVSTGKVKATLTTGRTRFSPDGKTICGADLSSSKPPVVKLWDMDGVLRHTLSGLRDVVTFSPDGRALLGQDEDGGLELWDAQSGTRTKRLGIRKSALLSEVFSPDGALLAANISKLRAAFLEAVDFDFTKGAGDVMLWDVSSGALKNDFKSQEENVLQAAFVDNGQSIFRKGFYGGSINREYWGHAARNDGGGVSAQMWDARSGALKRLVFKRADLEDGIFALAPNGRLLAAVKFDARLNNPDPNAAAVPVELWNLETGVLERTLTLKKSEAIASLVFSHDSKTLAGSGAEWQPGGELLFTNDPDMIKDGKSGIALLPGASSYRFSNSWQHGLHPGDIIQKLGGKAVKTRAQLDEQAARHAPYQMLKLSILRAGKVIELPVPLIPNHSSKPIVKLWDVATGIVKTTLAASLPVRSVANSQGMAALVSGSVFSPDDKSLALHGQLWDVATGKIRRKLKGDSLPTFSADGRLMATVADSKADSLIYKGVDYGSTATTVAGSIEVRNRAGALQCVLHGAEGTPTFSPDGKTIITGYFIPTHHKGDPVDLSQPDPVDYKSVRLWDTQTGKLRATLPRFRYENELLTAFSPDGKTLCAVGDYMPPSLWDASTGALKTVLRGHSALVSTIAFSPDGERLLSGSLDNTMKLWSVRAGRLLATMIPLPEVGDEVQARAISLGDKAIMLGDKAISLGDKAVTGSGEWFVTTPEGFFDCSANAAKFIRWNVGGDLFPAERYYRRFRRPDLVQKALRGEAITESAFTNDDVPPTAQFTALKYDGAAHEYSYGGATKPDAASAISSVSAMPSISVTLDTRSRSEIKPQDVTLLVNGRPLPPDVLPQISDISLTSAASNQLNAKALISLGDKAIILGDKAISLGDKSATEAAISNTSYKFARRFTFNVPLPLGAKEVQLRAVAYDNNGLGSNWAQMTPISRPAAKAVAGNLYVLCVGVGQYQNADGIRLKNLKFASGDARDVAARLQKEGAPLYQKVEVYSGGALLDQEATPGNIRAGLKWLQEKVRPGQIDTVVVFLSGHGLSDAQGRYFFPTHVFDAHDIQGTSVSGEELQRELGGKLRAKSVFLFVDTCHSGALAGARSDDLNFDINASGVYMMASSGSAQSSYESESWGHGAFTLALLKSLGSRALARDGAIRFDVLTYAVPAEIARLMREAQQNPGAEEPVVPLEGRKLDEAVAQAR